MEQYIHDRLVFLLEVIENGSAPPITKVVKGIETTIAPTTAEEKAQRRLELESKSTLLIGIPNETSIRSLNSYKDAKFIADKGVIDSGCSRHMTGSMSYLTDYEEINKGYVAFGVTPKEGKSQAEFLERTICFSVDVKQCVPKGGLTCLFAKATSDESKLWHRRLGHINFKTLNKLVKGNLVRGLPLNFFENNQTYVACQKGKQHKASCTKACDDAGKARIETVPGKDYILLPLWTADPPFSQSLKSSHNAGFKPLGDDGKKVDENPRKYSEGIDQEKEDNVKSTNNVNVASTNEVNVVGRKTSIELLLNPNMPPLEDNVYLDDDEDVGTEANMKNLDAFMHVSPIPITRVHKDHPVEQIIGDLNSTPQIRRMTKNLEEHGIDYDEVFAPVVRIEAIRLFLAYASFKDFVVYQMDVKSAFLYGKIEDEVYVCQPPGFEDPDFPDRVYKVEKALYGLHQAPRA
ncbi:ribonuclease H-like domain-containing protein, partial [Tanacetum coccineum]